jgi:L-ribulose-5-phosphate 3-epimerase
LEFAGTFATFRAMNHDVSSDRRAFLRAGAAFSAACLLPSPLQARAKLKGRILTTLKIGMIAGKGSLTEKFATAKAAGFDGVELNAPGIDIKETLAAINATGLPVDGNVNGTHWGVRHSDPDPKVRAQALESLKEGLRQTKAVGGHTLLLVVGHGKDGSEEDVWKRSVDNISKAVPLAAELGVIIAIENVWNQFCYDHDGDANQTAYKLTRFVDEFASPWVGMQYDLGNHWKYGPTGDWVRMLGKRIVKLDIKGFSRKTNKFTKIGEGDVDWEDVSQALLDIRFQGWCAAEVGGGDLSRLKEVSANMDKALGLKG